MMECHTNLSKVQGLERNYALHTLGWKAFQNLCSTVTGEIFGQTIETYFDSHDGGRDGAFSGIWKTQKGECFRGAFTVQCKFTANPEKHIQYSDLQDEFQKAERLASRGFAKNYFLFTNAKLKGTTEEDLKKTFESIPGIEQFCAFGRERISQWINESPRLRMLVPRIYGLGDLSQIIDERAYDQAKEILNSLGDDLRKFVITNAHRKSAKALGDHGFVFLLGEPASGKSTIAATLAVGALDQWGGQIIKARNADDFVKHYNPHESKQLFWVDDVFGATQLNINTVHDWNRSFSHLNVAIKNGAKIIFTSRSYIYNAAKRFLKESSLPVIKESQVVIQVEELTKQEREEILYNHIRLGNQSKNYKSKIKPFLKDVASHEKFKPEIARRLGDSMFTKGLELNKVSLEKFISYPIDFLREVIATLDIDSQAALALVFMREGVFPMLAKISEEEKQILIDLGGTENGVKSALNHMNGSLVASVLHNNSYFWQYKHPTIGDAFAEIIADRIELVDILIAGTPAEKLFAEISCGDMHIEGVKVIIPPERYDAIIDKLSKLNLRKWDHKNILYRFLAYRCSYDFLLKYLEKNTKFIQSIKIYSYFYVVSEIDIIIRLYDLKLLPESKRLEIVNDIQKLAVEIPDSSFLKERIRKLFNREELSDILENIRQNLLPNLDDVIDEWRDNFDEDDPQGYFDSLISDLETYRNEFIEDTKSITLIDNALSEIDDVIYAMQTEIPEKFEQYSHEEEKEVTPNEYARSIFDDVDI